MAKIKIGKIPVYKGEYDNNTIYNRLNQVTYLGTTFQSIVDDNLGHPPAEKSKDGGEITFINTNYWDIIAKGIDNVEERTATDNSMGYKILKKNKSFTEQVTEENTIYEIRYNFTLTEDITIPANCVLKFDGGSISGEHIITGNKTIIQAGIVKIFDTNVTLAGTWNVAEAYPEWFGLDNVAIAINKAFVISNSVKLTKNAYSLDTEVLSNGAIIEVPENGILFSDVIYNLRNNTQQLNVSCDKDCSVIKLNTCSIIKGISVKVSKSGECEVKGINASSVNTIRIEKCVVVGCDTGIYCKSYLTRIESTFAYGCSTGFFLDAYSGQASTTSTTIVNCWATSCSKYGYRIKGVVYSNLFNCAADACGIEDEESYPYSIEESQAISLINCGMEESPKIISITSYCRDIFLSNCEFAIGDYNSLSHEKAINIYGSTNVNIYITDILSTVAIPSNFIYVEPYIYYDDVYINRPLLYFKNTLINKANINRSNIAFGQYGKSRHVVIDGIRNRFGGSGYEVHADISDIYLNTDIDRTFIKNEDDWEDFDGYIATSNKGNENSRPKGVAAIGGVLRQKDIGFKYWDNTYKKLIFANAINSENGDVTWLDAIRRPVEYLNYHLITINNDNKNNTFKIRSNFVIIDNLNVKLTLGGNPVFSTEGLSDGEMIFLINKRKTPTNIAIGITHGFYNEVRTTGNVTIPAFGFITIIKQSEYFYINDNFIVPTEGTFSDKPKSSAIVTKGFRYFCTDKSTSEGGTLGIPIFFKEVNSSDSNNPIDIWVDALGRVVS